jgi:hypothetical protein
MDERRINDMVDKKIIESLRMKCTISDIQSELKTRMNNFTKSIKVDTAINYDKLYNTNFEDIKIVRHRYGITYIKQCQKRVNDLNWILDNKSKFERYSNFEIFKLIQLKDKLSS